MGKAAIIVAALVAGAVVAALAAGPAAVDAGRFKPQVAAALAEAFGGAASIDGPLTAAAAWPPTLRAADVRLAGGAAGQIRFASVELIAAAAPLATGKLEIRSARLIGADLSVERSAGEAARGPLDALALLTQAPAALEELSVIDGRLRYRDPGADVERTLTDIDIALTASGADGGRVAEGSARWGGAQFAGAVSLARAPPGEPAALRARLESGGAVLAFRGAALPGPDFGVEGRLTLRGRLSETLAAALAAPTEDDSFIPSLAGLEIDGAARIRYEAGSLAAQDISLRIGGMAAAGAATVSTAPPRLEAALSANRVDLDALFAAPGAAAAAARALAAAASPPAGLDGALSLAADALVYRGGIVRDARLEARFDDGAATLRRVSALFPGRSEIALSGAAAPAPGGPLFDGRVEGRSDNLRALLDWLGIGAAEVPADRLRRAHFAAALAGDLRSWRANGLEIDLDTTRATGSVAYEAAPRATLNAALDIDRLDLDAYRPAADADAQENEAESNAKFPTLPALPAEIDAGFALSIGALTAAGAAMREVRVEGALERGALHVREARTDDLGGAAIAATAALSGAGDAFALEGAITVRAGDAAAFARAVPALPALSADFGAAALDAAFSGGRDSIALEAEIAARDSRLTVSGSLIDPLATPLYDLAAAFDAPNLAALLEGFGAYDAAAAPPLLAGPASARGELFGNAAALAFNGSGTLDDGAWSLRVNVDSAGETRRFDLEVSARFPDFARLARLLAGPDPAAAPQSLSGPFDANIAATGAEDDFALDAAADLAGGALSLSGRVAGMDENRSWAFDAALDHPDSAGLLSAFGFRGALARRPGAVRLSGAVSGNRNGLEIRDLAAALADRELRGRAALEFSGPRTKIAADLAAGRIAAADFLPAGAFGDLNAESSETFDFSPLRRFDAELSLAAEALDLAGYVFKDASLEASLHDGALRLESLAGGLFGGSATVAGRLEAGAAPRLHGAIALRGADAGPLLARAADIRSWRGPIDVDVRFATEGTGKRRMFRALDGTGAFRGAGGEIDGLDLEAAAAALEADEPFSGAALEAGSTAYRGIEGNFDIAGGRLRAPNIVLTAEGAAAEIAVDADLAAWRHRLAARIDFAAHPDLPPVFVRREGPIDAPRRRVEFGTLARAAAGGGGGSPPADAPPGPPTDEGVAPAPPPPAAPTQGDASPVPAPQTPAPPVEEEPAPPAPAPRPPAPPAEDNAPPVAPPQAPAAPPEAPADEFESVLDRLLIE